MVTSRSPLAILPAVSATLRLPLPLPAPQVQLSLPAEVAPGEAIPSRLFVKNPLLLPVKDVTVTVSVNGQVLGTVRNISLPPSGDIRQDVTLTAPTQVGTRPVVVTVNWFGRERANRGLNLTVRSGPPARLPGPTQPAPVPVQPAPIPVQPAPVPIQPAPAPVRPAPVPITPLPRMQPLSLTTSHTMAGNRVDFTAVATARGNDLSQAVEWSIVEPAGAAGFWSRGATTFVGLEPDFSGVLALEAVVEDPDTQETVRSRESITVTPF